MSFACCPTERPYLQHHRPLALGLSRKPSSLSHPEAVDLPPSLTRASQHPHAHSPQLHATRGPGDPNKGAQLTLCSYAMFVIASFTSAPCSRTQRTSSALPVFAAAARMPECCKEAPCERSSVQSAIDCVCHEPHARASSLVEKGSEDGVRPYERKVDIRDGEQGTERALPSWVSRPSKMEVWTIRGS